MKQNNRYKKLYEKGLKYQNFICEELGLTAYKNIWEQFNIGETKEGVEIKLDDLMDETENIYFEISEKTVPSDDFPWIHSGIYRNDNSNFLLIGNYRIAYVFRISKLRKIFEEKQYDNLKEAKSGTSKGFVVSIRRIENEVLYEKLVIFKRK